ncbi:MAG TPA: iron-containing alcohol dehydrogenase [Terriglobia bacterium]|nr:iron-containing alcohol dehydrogenase [Terriglobia bacterium]
MGPFEFQPRTRAVFGAGEFARLGLLASGLGFHRTLVVSDAGLVATGLAARALSLLADAGIEAWGFHDFESNPDSNMVAAGSAVAARHNIDSLVALGGGSSLDCAKGINFIHTNGGVMRDYHGFGKAARPMLPSIGIPTTAGTGSEAQSYALISDSETHRKMACGDPKAAFRLTILDPELTVSQPRGVTAAAGFDALSHTVESFVTARRTAVSDLFARDGWRLIEGHFERALNNPTDLEARSAMLWGAHEAGIAIEQSMLGATHACANPLTAHYGTTHAVAIAVMLPHVVRWNGAAVGGRYAEMLRVAGREAGSSEEDSGAQLATRIEELARIAGLPRSLQEIGVPQVDLPQLATDATREWTGTFNPRPLDAAAALALYERAY